MAPSGILLRLVAPLSPEESVAALDNYLAHSGVTARFDLIENAFDGRAYPRVGFFNRVRVHSTFEETGHVISLPMVAQNKRKKVTGATFLQTFILNL